MVQAAAGNHIDFSTAELRGRRWWTKTRWIMDQLEMNNVKELLKLQHSQHVQVIDYSSDDSAFDSHWKQANAIMTSTYDILFPWLMKDKDRNPAREKIMEDWKKQYGNLPKGYFDKIAKAMRKKRESAEAGVKGADDFRTRLRKLNEKRRKKRGG